MAAILLSSPTLFSAHLLSIRGGNSKKITPSSSRFSVRCAVDMSFEGSVSKFSRVNVWDPYKRLGITTDAFEEEVWIARNFLLNQYVAHETSAESIEAAFERLLMNNFKNRKRTKINLKTKLKKKVKESPTWVKNLLSFVEVPPPVIILRRLFLFLLHGMLERYELC